MQTFLLIWFGIGLIGAACLMWSEAVLHNGYSDDPVDYGQVVDFTMFGLLFVAPLGPITGWWGVGMLLDALAERRARHASVQ